MRHFFGRIFLSWELLEEPSAQTTEAELEEGLIHKLFMVKQPETGGI